MLRAIQGDSNTNIIATPSAVTMDNQEAELKVAQEVPFVTGSYTNTGNSGNNGDVNPFTTVQREEVGTILKITPQINEGGALVQLKIELESSSLTGRLGRREQPHHQQAHRSAPTCSSKTAASSCSAA